MPEMQSAGPIEFRCRDCGAVLTFDPDTQSLKCSHCGVTNPVTDITGSVAELDYCAELQRLRQTEPTHEQLTFTCSGCGAQSIFPPDVTAGACPFCGSPVSAASTSQKAIRPRSMLPFSVTCAQGTVAFQTWVSGLWFAPTELKKRADRSALQGTYLPAWTYDSDTQSDYRGERGDHYWETQNYTEYENGKSVSRTRQVQMTRWSSARGTVRNRFDDLLVMATQSLPPKILSRLEPWDLPNLMPYADGYRAGFIVQSYQVNLEHGFDAARQMLEGDIRRTIERTIGGDEQRISSVQAQYDNIRFRHILLPVWISAYRYREKVYRFLINARTGEVQGERPYSWVKILLLVLVILILFSAIVAYSQR